MFLSDKRRLEARYGLTWAPRLLLLMCIPYVPRLRGFVCESLGGTVWVIKWYSMILDSYVYALVFIHSLVYQFLFLVFLEFPCTYSMSSQTMYWASITIVRKTCVGWVPILGKTLFFLLLLVIWFPWLSLCVLCAFFFFLTGATPKGLILRKFCLTFVYVLSMHLC